MKTRLVALLAVALIAAVSPAIISLAAGASQAATHANHTTGPPGTVPPCDFDHPTSLPPQASPNATAALKAPAGFNTAGFAIADTHYAGNGQTTQTPANSAAVSQYDVACFQAGQH